MHDARRCTTHRTEFRIRTRIPALDILAKELTLAGSNCYGLDADRSDFALAAAMLGSMQDQLAAILTHRFPLREIRRGFDTAMNKSTGAIKVQVQPG